MQCHFVSVNMPGYTWHYFEICKHALPVIYGISILAPARMIFGGWTIKGDNKGDGSIY